MVVLNQVENVVVCNSLCHVSRMHELCKLSITTGSIEEFEREIFGNGRQTVHDLFFEITSKRLRYADTEKT